ncbi:hypothetical protein [Actinokineospora sp.]|uniref:hypothetical protein n=1 Tax=Actinokineospora sp. TaxID=1872133 RepID=UPI00403796C9
MPKAFVPLLVGALVVSLATPVLGDTEWHSVGRGMVSGVSGAALIRHSATEVVTLVVRDNKKPGQNRAAVVTFREGAEPVVEPLTWQGAEPADLEAVDAVPGSPAASPARDVYAWPFAWDSVWNLPLATTAEYQAFDPRFQWLYLDKEDISVDPGFPVKTVRQNDTGERNRVHTDPKLEADGSWNHCATLLMDTPDKKTVLQGQPMTLTKGGDPSWNYSWKPLSLTGQGIEGCHGGSGLSGIGGTIRGGELVGPQPIRHALKLGMNCGLSCSKANNGFRWPAYKADKGWQDRYHGTNPHVNMGSLMALPPDYDLSWITRPDVRKIAETLKTYGAYIVDATGGKSTNSLAMDQKYAHEFPNIDSAEMRTVLHSLAVITNSGQATPGGGSLTTPRRAECAPAFADGTGGAPPNCGASVR